MRFHHSICEENIIMGVYQEYLETIKEINEKKREIEEKKKILCQQAKHVVDEWNKNHKPGTRVLFLGKEHKTTGKAYVHQRHDGTFAYIMLDDCPYGVNLCEIELVTKEPHTPYKYKDNPRIYVTGLVKCDGCDEELAPLSSIVEFNKTDISNGPGRDFVWGGSVWCYRCNVAYNLGYRISLHKTGKIL